MGKISCLQLNILHLHIYTLFLQEKLLCTYLCLCKKKSMSLFLAILQSKQLTWRMYVKPRILSLFLTSFDKFNKTYALVILFSTTSIETSKSPIALARFSVHSLPLYLLIWTFLLILQSPLVVTLISFLMENVIIFTYLTFTFSFYVRF